MDYIKHLKSSDVIMENLIKKYGIIRYRARYLEGEEHYFRNLITSIIGQQLSIKAAATIERRVVNYFNGEITPLQIINSNSDDLRLQGLSRAKVEYIKKLSSAVHNRQLNLSKINELSDNEVINELVKVKGIGKWTAEMFLIFSLKRQDVFSFSDVGLLNAIKKLYGSALNREELVQLTDKWRPFRTYACLYLWRSLE